MIYSGLGGGVQFVSGTALAAQGQKLQGLIDILNSNLGQFKWKGNAT